MNRDNLDKIIYSVGITLSGIGIYEMASGFLLDRPINFLVATVATYNTLANYFYFAGKHIKNASSKTDEKNKNKINSIKIYSKDSKLENLFR